MKHKMIKNLVSVVIPVYNCEKYIRFCVDSVLKQDYKKYEVIIVNDGSTDNTKKILTKEYKKYYPKVRMIDQTNHGAAHALNRAIKLAKGEWIAWLSSDDMSLKNRLKEEVTYAKKYPEYDVVYSDFYIINNKGNITKKVKSPWYKKNEFIFKKFQGNFINGSSLLAKKELFLKYGYFNENLRYSYDGDLFLRFLINNVNFGHVNKYLIKYRWHVENMSHHFRKHAKETNYVLKTYLKNSFNIKKHPVFISDKEFIKRYKNLADLFFINRHYRVSLYMFSDMLFTLKKISIIFVFFLTLIKFGVSLFTRLYKKISK